MYCVLIWGALLERSWGPVEPLLGPSQTAWEGRQGLQECLKRAHEMPQEGSKKAPQSGTKYMHECATFWGPLGAI